MSNYRRPSSFFSIYFFSSLFFIFFQKVNLSHNKLTELGQFRFLESLIHLNIEANELKTIPPELALLPKLKTLTAGGNPQRTIPLGTVEAGANQLLPFLRKRLGDRYQVPEWVVAARENGSPASSSSSSSSSSSNSTSTSTSSSGRGEGSGAAAVPITKATADGETGGSGGDGAEVDGEGGGASAEVVALKAEVEELDRQLSDMSLTAANKHAIKKKRQMKNAERIRAERKVSK
jgi:hypothetical protein